MSTNGKTDRGRQTGGNEAHATSEKRPANVHPAICASCAESSQAARQIMESLPHEPFWMCQWRDVVFLHLETDPAVLRRVVPFELDLFEGRAFVTLVAFTLRDMRPRIGGFLARCLFKPFGTHRFLNVRAYVKHDGQRGIYFLAEYLDAPGLNHLAGPALYGLPFHVAKLEYDNSMNENRIHGTVSSRHGTLAYDGLKLRDQSGNNSGSGHDPQRTEFLLERYRAFTERNGTKGWFPVWHKPWWFEPVDARLIESSLLAATGEWSGKANLVAAHYSRGSDEVWMGLRQML